MEIPFQGGSTLSSTPVSRTEYRFIDDKEMARHVPSLFVMEVAHRP